MKRQVRMHVEQLLFKAIHSLIPTYMTAFRTIALVCIRNSGSLYLMFEHISQLDIHSGLSSPYFFLGT